MIDQLKSIGILLVAPTLLFVFLLTTDPYKLPLIFIVVPFMLIAFSVYLIMRTGLNVTPLSATKIRLIAGIVTALLVLLLVLQSLHQLSIKDFLILSALLLGLTFYLRRIDI